MSSNQRKRLKLKNKTSVKRFISVSSSQQSSRTFQKETGNSATDSREDQNNIGTGYCESKLLIDMMTQLKFNFVTLCKDKEVQNMFIQDEFMKAFYAYYPEFVCIDVVCEIPELKQFLILLIGLDSNGHCEIISVGLTKSETSDGFLWICETFKKNNPCWENVQFILSDQSYDRDTLKSAFPQKVIFTSFFHCMKAFKKDLSSLDNLVTEEDINKALQIFEKMMFETSETIYAELLKQMKQTNVQVFNLFKRKWHVKRNFWALGLLTDSKTFLKVFNVYLLSIRRKLKPVIGRQDTIENVIRNLHTTIYKLRKEYFQHFTKIYHSPSAPYLKIPVMQKYANLLTPFGSELLYEQLKKSNYIKNVLKWDRPFYYKVDENIASSYTCYCNFHKFMKLPCSHILAVRKHLSIPQFHQNVRPSWILTNYCNIYHTLYSAHVFQHEKTKAEEMSYRFKEYVQVCQELWSKIFDCSEKISQERLEVFQNILKSWKNGFDVDVVRSEKQDASLGDNIESIEDLPTDCFKEFYGISVEDLKDSENEFTDVSLDHEDNIFVL